MNGNENEHPLPPGIERQTGPQIVKTVPAAEQADVEVKKEEKPGFFARIANFFKSATKKVAVVAGAVTGRIAGLVHVVVAAVWTYVLNPVVSFVERWVPGMSELRGVFKFWVAVMLVIGFMTGFIVAAEIGAGVALTLGLALLGVVLVPVIALTTPAFWPQILMDLWIMSVVVSVFLGFADWINSKGALLTCLSFRLAPGYSEVLAPAGTVHPTTGEILNEKPIDEVAAATAPATV